MTRWLVALAVLGGFALPADALAVVPGCNQISGNGYSCSLVEQAHAQVVERTAACSSFGYNRNWTGATRYMHNAGGKTYTFECQYDGTLWQSMVNASYSGSSTTCANGDPWNSTTHQCEDPLPTEAECLARPEVVNQWSIDGDPATPDRVCNEGCAYEAFQDADTHDVFYTTYNPTTDGWYGSCVVGEADPAPTACADGVCYPDADGDGTPDGEDAFPNDPSETADTDGDGVGNNADTADDDPTNGKDGGAGDETDNEASGSGSCAAPPQCSGDAIQCEILYTNWKISCSGASVSGSPEQCNTAYECTGDTAQCAQIALLRKTACSSLVQGNVDSDGDGNGIADALEEGVADLPGTEPGLGSVDGGALWGEVDQDGWLSGGTCPGLPAISSLSGFEAVSAKLCEHGNILAGLFLAAAMAGAAYIIGRAATGS